MNNRCATKLPWWRRPHSWPGFLQHRTDPGDIRSAVGGHFRSTDDAAIMVLAARATRLAIPTCGAGLDMPALCRVQLLGGLHEAQGDLLCARFCPAAVTIHIRGTGR